MSFFGTTRRITERTVHRKLFSPPPRVDYGVTNKEKNLTKKGTTEVLNEVRKNMTQQITTSKELCASKVKVNELTAHYKSTNDFITDVNQITLHKIFDVSDIKPYQRLFHKPYLKWFAKNPNEKGGPVRQSGGRFGKLGAANEAGFFHKSDRERLMELKKKLKEKEQGPDAPKT